MNGQGDENPTIPSGAFAEGTTAFERYVILAELGSGGSGRVYKANDVLLNKTIALKVLKYRQLDTLTQNRGASA